MTRKPKPKPEAKAKAAPPPSDSPTPKSRRRRATPLDRGRELKRIIALAERGDLSSAWLLVHMLEDGLMRNICDPALQAYAARFFGDLLDKREASEKEVDSAKALAPAFRTLNIVKGRGQPARSEDESDLLAIRMVFARSVYETVEAASSQLAEVLFEGDKGRFPASAYVRAFNGLTDQNEPRGAFFMHALKEGILSLEEVETSVDTTQESVIRQLAASDVELQSRLKKN